MLNIGGGELLVIMLVALIVLGPTKLPGAAQQAGKFMSELRKLSTGFQREMRDAMNDMTVETEARERGRAHVAPDPAAEITPSDPLPTESSPAEAPPAEAPPAEAPPAEPSVSDTSGDIGPSAADDPDASGI